VIEPIRTDYGKGSYEQMRNKMLDFTMEKVEELRDTVNKLTGECPTCKGKKFIYLDKINTDGNDVISCPICNGSGVKGEKNPVNDQSAYVCTCGQEWDNHDPDKCKPENFNTPKPKSPLSACCKMYVREEKHKEYTTYICTDCGRPCDLYEPKSDGLEEVIEQFEWDIQHFASDENIRNNYNGEIDNLWKAIAAAIRKYIKEEIDKMYFLSSTDQTNVLTRLGIT